MTTSSSSMHIGTDNNLQGAGTGQRIGVNNTISGAGTGTHFGTYNGLVGSGSGTKYGSYNYISDSAGGTQYGVYSEVIKSGSYAGYFLGSVSIGTTTANNYILPASRGTADQIMQTDGAGNVSWVSNSSPALKISTPNNVSLTNAVEYNVVYPTVIHNLGGGTYNTATGTYTVPSTGVYSITANLPVDFNGAGTNQMVMGFRVYVNGFYNSQLFVQGGAYYSLSYTQNFSFTNDIYLAAGDQITFRVLPVFGAASPAPVLSFANANIMVRKI
ncbi:MAG: hypothetical protein R2781_07840 [Flavobacteriaceae bacterium]